MRDSTATGAALSAILTRLYRPRRLAGPQVLLEDVKAELRKTLRLGEGSSCLVVGPHGSGKSLCVELALDTLKGEVEYAYFHLDGRHFKNELQVFAAILDQISHHDNEAECQPANFRDLWNFLIDVVRRPIIFVLDALEEFVRFGKQQLLYNLFDITGHSGSTESGSAVCVVAMTTKLNIFTALDNRVVSRFSRNVLVAPAIRFEELLEHLRYVLHLTAADGDFSESFRLRFNEGTNSLLGDANFANIIRRIWENSRDFRDLQNILSAAISGMKLRGKDSLDSELVNSAFLDYMQCFSLERYAQECTWVELCFLLASVQLQESHRRPEIEYRELHAKVQDWEDLIRTTVTDQKPLGDRPLTHAFEKLLSAGIFEPVGKGEEGSLVGNSMVDGRFACVLNSIEIHHVVNSRRDIPHRLKQLARTT